MSDGFLRRWSARKLDAQQARPIAPAPQEPVEPAAAAGGDAEAAAPAAALPVPIEMPAECGPAGPEAAGADTAAVPPAPTLEDVKSLTAQSDFSRFARQGVAPEVKNAAMKKLFSDPRYNVMDGLDVYVDDYSRPDAMPESMVRQLAGAAFLRLFDEEAGQHAQRTAEPRDVADNPEAKTVPQSGTVSAAASEPTADADPDLRLQQDDAAAGASPRPGTA